ncbi:MULTISPECIES: phosphoethanolamine transferase [Photorhabdus]|uniref:Outer-membrane protein yhbx n=2 Tax=Photorhabdus asymbiotica TaxID=291112 RepID=C7BTZ0_PHOAA|nr:phosphoethanolamine transferase [Photorhabdus asymbiotica]RKS54678.1 glucan phosphoethanolaminetransferase (alkaline phosphatase superfamily) [Photorhabdus asymbiotica]CAQ82152.1 outer-membrane protein yhbx [Photorhabdus asymbiotica]
MQNKLSILIISLLTLLPIIFIGDIAHEYKLRIVLLNFFLAGTSAFLYRFNYLKPLVFITSLLWSLNISTSFFFSNEYQINFSSTIANTFINTNSNEAVGMLSYNKHYVLFFIFMLLTYFLSIRWLSKNTNYRLLKFSVWALFFTCLLVPIDYYISEKKLSDNIILTEYFLMVTPFNNSSAIVRAIYENQQIRKIASVNVKFNYIQEDKNIDTYILLIGESARRDHMSLYGYDKATTPTLDAMQKNMLIFNQAISPASVTILSVPISLSNITLYQLRDKAHYADNIISLAKDAGFNTTWISNQGRSGKSNSLITVIANMAESQKWNKYIGYDEELLPYLDDALKQKGKKFIIMHIYGSHEPSCNRFPENKLISFSSNKDDNCYDSSIAYTDLLIDKIIDKLKGNKASILYFSDHGLQRLDKDGDIRYHHGVSNPRKDSYNIPLLIWYDDSINSQYRHTGVINTPFSTTDNYYLISDWLGIHHKSPEHCRSPLSNCFKSLKELMVIDGNKNLMEYSKLPDEKDIKTSGK